MLTQYYACFNTCFCIDFVKYQTNLKEYRFYNNNKNKNIFWNFFFKNSPVLALQRWMHGLQTKRCLYLELSVNNWLEDRRDRVGTSVKKVGNITRCKSIQCLVYTYQFKILKTMRCLMYPRRQRFFPRVWRGALPLIPKQNSRRCNKIPWSIRSKAAKSLGSNKAIDLLFLIAPKISSWPLSRAVSVLWRLL